MTRWLARLAMAVAIASLGRHRQGWGCAMRAEFDVAAGAGEGLSFATGCLMAAWRELPTHGEGRLTLARYTFALGLILPAAALLLAGVVAGYPYIDAPYAASIAPLAKGETGLAPVNTGNEFAVPVLALFVLLQVAAHALVAWFAVGQDWHRAARAQCFGAAVTITLALFAGVIVIDATCVVLPVIALAIELLAIALLRHWHDEAGEPAAAGEPG